MEVLKDHTSFETAYEVQDYPYGFRLRCKIRYWIEWNEKKGARVWSCTTNPKQAGERWNKPKAGIWHKYGAVLYINSEGHVVNDYVDQHADAKPLQSFEQSFGDGLPEAYAKQLRQLISYKLRYAEKRAAGVKPAVALAEMRLEDAQAAAAAARCAYCFSIGKHDSSCPVIASVVDTSHES